MTLVTKGSRVGGGKSAPGPGRSCRFWGIGPVCLTANPCPTPARQMPYRCPAFVRQTSYGRKTSGFRSVRQRKTKPLFCPNPVLHAALHLCACRGLRHPVRQKIGSATGRQAIARGRPRDVLRAAKNCADAVRHQAPSYEGGASECLTSLARAPRVRPGCPPGPRSRRNGHRRNPPGGGRWSLRQRSTGSGAGPDRPRGS